MADCTGWTVDSLETPQLLIDLDLLDTNLNYLQRACQDAGKDLRVHFKSLKCGGLAQYLASRGVRAFLCAKLNEASVLIASGLTDVLVANQIIGPVKLARLAKLARHGKILVCVDDAENVRQMATVVRQEQVQLDVLIEVDTGMNRCGVEPGEATLALAQVITAESGLRFAGLQGYDGHLQLLADHNVKKARCLEGLDKLHSTRHLLEQNGIPVPLVTGAGTGTWEFAANHPALTELQPGSFLLMDAAYHAVRPEFACSLTVLTTVISRRPDWYVLDAGSKAISKDFGNPQIKAHPDEEILVLAEEHTRVIDHGRGPKTGEQREVIPAHCCATMNLHRRVLGVRKGKVEMDWPIEASGRYD